MRKEKKIFEGEENRDIEMAQITKERREENPYLDTLQRNFRISNIKRKC